MVCIKRRFLQYTSHYKKVYWDPNKTSSTFLYWDVCTVELKEQPNHKFELVVNDRECCHWRAYCSTIVLPPTHVPVDFTHVS